MKTFYNNPTLLFSSDFQLRFNVDFTGYVYFTYAAASSTVIDDVTKSVMCRIFNTNL